MPFKSVVLLLFFVNFAQAFRALYMASNIGYSHIEYTGKLADTLVDAGHEVDFVVQVWDTSLKHNGSRKANIIRFVGKNMDKLEAINQKMTMRGNAFERDWNKKDWDLFGEFFGAHCDALLSDHKLLNFMRTRNYTVGLAESFDTCALAVFRSLGIKSVHETCAFPMSESASIENGIPVNFRHIPLFQNYEVVEKIGSFFDVLRNFYYYLLVRFYLRYSQQVTTNEVIQRELGPDYPHTTQLQGQFSYIWVNTYEFMDFPRLNSPKVKHIGGIVVKDPPPMNKQIFNNSTKGVVLVSFGSLVNTAYMKPEMRKQLLETFASFPDYEFVWRLTELTDEILTDVQKYPNVHAFKWLQQTAILAHPKTAAFVSHVGLNSLNEAVYFGVPIVAVPFFGDQPMNAAMVVKRGNGIFVSRKEMSKLHPALEEVLHNKKYKERALDLKAKVRNMPTKPEELFVKHVEFSERFDIRKDLELDSANDTFVEEFNLDIIGLALLVLILFFILVAVSLRYLYIGVVLFVKFLDFSNSSKKLD